MYVFVGVTVVFFHERYAYKGLYIMEAIAQPSIQTLKHSCAKSCMVNLRNKVGNVFPYIATNTPYVIVVEFREVSVQRLLL
jgi:hypothetical protein